jgi:hypothetical protein
MLHRFLKSFMLIFWPWSSDNQSLFVVPGLASDPSCHVIRAKLPANDCWTDDLDLPIPDCRLLEESPSRPKLVRQGLIFRFELMSCRSLQGLRWADILRLSEANHHGGKLVDKMILPWLPIIRGPSMKNFSRVGIPLRKNEKRSFGEWFLLLASLFHPATIFLSPATIFLALRRSFLTF